MEIWKVPLIYLFGKYEKVLFGQVFVFISEVITCGFHFLSNHLDWVACQKSLWSQPSGLKSEKNFISVLLNFSSSTQRCIR